MATIIKAGFGKGIIHFPESMFPIEGFQGIHDAPNVRLMVLEFGRESIAILAAELVIIPCSSIDNWKKMISDAFFIPLSKVVVQMTHAITTPHEPGPMGPPDRRPEPTPEDLRKRALYHKATDEAVRAAIAETRKSRQTATFGWGNALCDVNVNCDIETPFGWWIGVNEHTLANHKMSILRVNDLQGQILGLLVSYGMKPAAIDNSGKKEGIRQISSEVAGAFCRKLEEKYHVPALYCVSAGGNQVPQKSALKSIISEAGEIQEMDEGVAQGFLYAEEQAEQMAQVGISIVDTIICAENASTVGWEQTDMTWQRKKGGPRRPMREMSCIPEKEIELTADLFAMGNTVFVFVRPEMTVEAEEILLKKSPFAQTILMTLTNGEMKCLPDQSAYDRATYEAQGSNLMPGAAESLIDRIVSKLLLMKQES